MILWITGLSGSGKTKLSEYIIKKLNKNFKNKIIHFDGDRFRNIFSDLNYSFKDRLKNAERISKLVNFLNTRLNILVIVSILSNSDKWLRWNRRNNKNYFQILLDVPISVLKVRNNKKIYSKKRNVVGMDIFYNKPKNNDFVFHNNYKQSFLNKSFKEIFKNKKIKKTLNKIKKI